MREESSDRARVIENDLPPIAQFANEGLRQKLVELYDGDEGAAKCIHGLIIEDLFPLLSGISLLAGEHAAIPEPYTLTENFLPEPPNTEHQAKVKFHEHEVVIGVVQV